MKGTETKSPFKTTNAYIAFPLTSNEAFQTGNACYKFIYYIIILNYSFIRKHILKKISRQNSIGWLNNFFL